MKTTLAILAGLCFATASWYSAVVFALILVGLVIQDIIEERGRQEEEDHKAELDRLDAEYQARRERLAR